MKYHTYSLLLLLLYFLMNTVNLANLKFWPSSFYCKNPCMECQNTIYYLKFHGEAQCRYSNCQDQCNTLTTQWTSNRNSHLNYFRQDSINICEACFRNGYCTINDCILEKSIIHHAVELAVEKYHPHFLSPNARMSRMIHLKPDNYFFPMDFLFRNTEKIISHLAKYEQTYQDLIHLKKFMDIALKKVTLQKKGNMTEGNMTEEKDNMAEENTESQLENNEDVRAKWRDIPEKIDAYKKYFAGIKVNRLHFNEDTVFLTTDASIQSLQIQNIVDFDQKIKDILLQAYTAAEAYRANCDRVLSTIHEVSLKIDNALNNEYLYLGSKRNSTLNESDISNEELLPKKLGKRDTTYTHETRLTEPSLGIEGNIVKQSTSANISPAFAKRSRIINEHIQARVQEPSLGKPVQGSKKAFEVYKLPPVNKNKGKSSEGQSQSHSQIGNKEEEGMDEDDDALEKDNTEADDDDLSFLAKEIATSLEKHLQATERGVDLNKSRLLETQSRLIN